MNNIKPMIYTLSTCVHCRAAKKFLEENGIEFDSMDVDRLNGKEKDDTISELMRISGSCRFPTIIVGDKIIIGFHKDQLIEALKL